MTFRCSRCGRPVLEAPQEGIGILIVFCPECARPLEESGWFERLKEIGWSGEATTLGDAPPRKRMDA